MKTKNEPINEKMFCALASEKSLAKDWNRKEEVKVWDRLSDEFDTYKENIFHGAADNIYTLWPILLSYIKKNIKGSSLRALDFGCGTGMFCRELKILGFDTYGLDISPKMIDIAKAHLGKEIKFSVGDYKTALKISKKSGKFDLITSIMVSQFVPDIQKCLNNLYNSLTDDGYLMFVVHNPKKLDERKIKTKLNVGETGKLVQIYKRDSKDYDKILRKVGFRKVLEKYPKTSRKFLKKYGQKDSMKIPKYMLMVYKKTNSNS